MKKGFVAITAAIALAASSLIGTGMAGIGPNRGLPDVTLATGTQDMYQVAATAAGINGSVMCVACHSRNPAKRTGYSRANGTEYVGSHWVTSNFNDTSRGGGYTDTSTGGVKLRSGRTNPIYMAGTGASATWSTNPKYGAGSPTAVNANVDASSASAQMICESCHNIVKNWGAAKLLATGFANGTDNTNYSIGDNVLQGHLAAGGTTVPTLCIGCHSSMTGGVTAEWQYHPNSNGGTWSGTHHHRNTGTAAWYGSGATATATMNMARMNRSYYPAAGTAGALQMWGANYGELQAAERDLTYASTGNKKMKGGAGFTNGTAYGQIVVAGAASPAQVLCTNCHRAHNAATRTGGTILMVTATATTFGGATTANAVSGMGALGRDTVIGNTNPLCLACHQ